MLTNLKCRYVVKPHENKNTNKDALYLDSLNHHHGEKSYPSSFINLSNSISIIFAASRFPRPTSVFICSLRESNRNITPDWFLSMAEIFSLADCCIFFGVFVWPATSTKSNSGNFSHGNGSGPPSGFVVSPGITPYSFLGRLLCLKPDLLKPDPSDRNAPRPCSPPRRELIHDCAENASRAATRTTRGMPSGTTSRGESSKYPRERPFGGVTMDSDCRYAGKD